jgi:hypothetical protein
VRAVGDACRFVGPDVSFAHGAPIIEGTVSDPDRKALAGIGIRIENDKGAIGDATTDAGGRYSFGGIPDGVYTLTFFYGSSIASSARARVVIAGPQTTLEHTLDLAKLPLVRWCA